jgi:hypothetical protein
MHADTQRGDYAYWHSKGRLCILTLKGETMHTDTQRVDYAYWHSKGWLCIMTPKGVTMHTDTQRGDYAYWHGPSHLFNAFFIKQDAKWEFEILALAIFKKTLTGNTSNLHCESTRFGFQATFVVVFFQANVSDDWFHTSTHAYTSASRTNRRRKSAWLSLYSNSRTVFGAQCFFSAKYHSR